MPGRGPTPKVGERLGHRSKEEREREASAVVGGDPRPVPRGRWHAKAKAWWESAARSDGAAVWDDAGWRIAERALALEDAFWRARDNGNVDLMMKANDKLRLQEQVLFLPPVDRFRAIRDGVVAPREVEAPAPANATGAASRARLRAVGD